MFLALVALASVATAPAPVDYHIHAAIRQDGKVIFDPRLRTRAGEDAMVVIGDDAAKYALKVVTNPDAGTGAVSMSLELVVTRKASSRRIATTVVVRTGEPVVLTLPATNTDPAVTVDVSADKV